MTSQCSYLAFVLRHGSTVMTSKCSVRKGRLWRQCRNEQPMIVLTEFCVHNITEHRHQTTMAILVSYKLYGSIASKWKNCTKWDSSVIWIQLMSTCSSLPVYDIQLHGRSNWLNNSNIHTSIICMKLCGQAWQSGQFEAGSQLTWYVYYYICSSFSEAIVLSWVSHSTRGRRRRYVMHLWILIYFLPFAFVLCQFIENTCDHNPLIRDGILPTWIMKRIGFRDTYICATLKLRKWQTPSETCRLCSRLHIAPILQWRQNEPTGSSNHQSHDCLLNRLFGRRSKSTSKVHVTGLCEVNSPVTG